MTGQLTLFTVGGEWRWSIWIDDRQFTVECKPTNRLRSRADAKAAGEQAARDLGITLEPLTP